MAATTPDAYRIGAGQVAQDYPADAAPVRARKRPSLPHDGPRARVCLL